MDSGMTKGYYDLYQTAIAIFFFGFPNALLLHGQMR